MTKKFDYYFCRMDYEPYIIGIAGGSASGKTSFLKDLKRNMPKGSVCIISQDNYYKPIEEQKIDENGQVNFDLPDSINRIQFYRDLISIRKGEEITIKEYTFNNKKKTPGLIRVQPAPIIIMEGLFIFHYEEIRKALDLRVFIDAREHVKLERRIKRDIEERGYPEKDVRYQWNNHVVPSYKKYLEPYRDDSHIIITNNSHYRKGLEVLVNHMKIHLPEHFSNRFIKAKIPATKEN
ncbi:uridine kinase family protein [Salibacter halophilus]|nr:uridine-cytidine kinase [Salibacter halophilus]